MIELIEDRAQQLGLGFSNLIEDAVLEALGLSRNPRTELLMRIANNLLGLTEFPPDIIKTTFDQIAVNTDLRMLYEQALDDAVKTRVGENRKTVQSQLNRRISLTITKVLKASPDGRVIGGLPPESLISSYSLIKKRV